MARLRLCIEPDCMQPTAGTRCPAHERAYQAERNRRPGRQPRRTRAYMDTVIPVGAACWCCGATEDLTRHHVTPLARTALVFAGENPDQYGGLIPMCRRCNSSIGTKRMAGLTCPMHGGQEYTP